LKLISASLCLLLACTDAFAQEQDDKQKTQDTIKLFRIVVMVKDVSKAADFYSKLLGKPGQYVGSGRHYFPAGGTILVLLDPAKDPNWEKIPPTPLPNYIYFSTPDLEDSLAKAKEAGATDLSEIIKQPWGERMFYAKDLDGNPISFVDESTLFEGK
jgi:lactoylglutathione lyase